MATLSALPDVAARITPQMGGGGDATQSVLPNVGDPIMIRAQYGGALDKSEEAFINLLKDMGLPLPSKGGNSKIKEGDFTEENYKNFISFIKRKQKGVDQSKFDILMEKNKKEVNESQVENIQEIREIILKELNKFQEFINQFKFYTANKGETLENQEKKRRQASIFNTNFNEFKVRFYDTTGGYYSNSKKIIETGIRILLLNGYINGEPMKPVDGRRLILITEAHENYKVGENGVNTGNFREYRDKLRKEVDELKMKGQEKPINTTKNNTPKQETKELVTPSEEPKPTTATATAEPVVLRASSKMEAVESIEPCYEKLREEMAKNPDFTMIIENLMSKTPGDLKDLLYSPSHADVRKILREMIALKVEQFKSALTTARGEKEMGMNIGIQKKAEAAVETAAVETAAVANARTDAMAVAATNARTVTDTGAVAVETANMGIGAEPVPVPVANTGAMTNTKAKNMTNAASEPMAVANVETKPNAKLVNVLPSEQIGGAPVYYRGIASLGQTCYCAAVLQFLYSIDIFRENILNYSGDEEPAKSLHIIFRNLNKDYNPTNDGSNPQIRINDEFDNLYCLDISEKGKQHDVPEFLEDCVVNKILSNRELSSLLEFMKTVKEKKIIDNRTNEILSTNSEPILRGNSYDISIIRGLDVNKENIQESYNNIISESVDDYERTNTKERIQITKKMLLTNNPEYVILVLSPFEIVDYNTGEQIKKEYEININETIDILFSEDNQEINKKYNLKGFIEHTGNDVKSGHYTYTQYFPENDSYVLLNDSIIEKRTDNPLENNKKVYVLLYQKDGTEKQNYERKLIYWSTQQQSDYVLQLTSAVEKENGMTENNPPEISKTTGGAKTRSKKRRGIRTKKTKRHPHQKK